MNGKVSKLLRKLSKERLLNYNKMKDKFKTLNKFDREQVIKDIKNILNGNLVFEVESNKLQENE